jgi:hypothetical protein
MKRKLPIVGLVLLWSCSYNSFEEKEQVDCSISDLTISLVEVVNTDCGLNNGSLLVVANGGLSPYSFILNDGASQSGMEFEELEAAEYLVKVVDSNGCQDDIEVSVQNKDGVKASLSILDSECRENKGSISIEANSGVEPYAYQLNDGPPQSSNIFTDLEPGLYKIKVSDADGCNLTLEDRVSSGVSFEASISDIISQNCAVSGCHAGSQSPDFRQFGNIQSNASRIKVRTQNKTMPRNGSLTQTEIDLIACWVDDGALNN